MRISKKGFTLIELMIVLSLILILSMVLIPKVGSLKIEAKNKSLEANVSFVQDYVEKRGPKDASTITSSISQVSNTLENALNTVLNDINSSKDNYFKNNNKIANPFSYSTSILINDISSDSSVVFKIAKFPSVTPNNISKNSTSAFPNNSSLKGKVLVFIYKDSYVLYGVNYYGEKVAPKIIQMNPLSISKELIKLPSNAIKTPTISHDNVDGDGNYTITITTNERIKATEWRLYENNSLIHTKPLTNNEFLTDSYKITGKPNGNYTYKAVLINDSLSSNSNSIQVTVGNTFNPNAPRSPIISHDNWDKDGMYTITMNMWWGNNGSLWKLYENGNLIYTKPLTYNSPNAQSDSVEILSKPNGIYVYKAELINQYGSSFSDELKVTVQNDLITAIPGTPILSDDNWNNDGNYTITMNMWWGNNGSLWKLYENGRLIYTKALTDNTPNPQKDSVSFFSKNNGIYVYRSELINNYGSSFSSDLQIQVVNSNY